MMRQRPSVSAATLRIRISWKDHAASSLPLGSVARTGVGAPSLTETWELGVGLPGSPPALGKPPGEPWLAGLAGASASTRYLACVGSRGTVGSFVAVWTLAPTTEPFFHDGSPVPPKIWSQTSSPKWTAL